MFRIATTSRNFIKTVQTFNNGIKERTKNASEQFESKIKGTMAEKWLKYWKNVFNDYKEVAIEVRRNMGEKPVKAAFIFSTLGFLTFCAKHNPNEEAFRDSFLTCSNDLILVHPSMQKKETVLHLRIIEQCYNRNLLRRWNLGLVSIMWIDNYSDTCNNYESTCTYLHMQYSKFLERIIDIGFLDKWWIMSAKMVNYDVNY